MSPAVLPATKAFLARCGRKVSSALRKVSRAALAVLRLQPC